MPFNNLHVDCYDMSPGDRVGVRVRRSDKAVLDADGKFRAVAQNPVFPLVAGTDLDQTVASADIPIDPSQFTDGNYRVYYHDLTSPTSRVFSEAEVAVFNGSADTIRTPTTTETALRMFSVNCASHVAPGSYGQAFNDMYQKIQAVYRWVSAQPGFSAKKNKIDHTK